MEIHLRGNTPKETEELCALHALFLLDHCLDLLYAREV